MNHPQRWKKIGTAPKKAAGEVGWEDHGPAILGYANGSMAVVRWCPYGNGYWSLAECGGYANSEWWPTYWQYLPNPPKVRK